MTILIMCAVIQVLMAIWIFYDAKETFGTHIAVLWCFLILLSWLFIPVYWIVRYKEKK